MTVGFVDDEVLPGALLVAAGSTDAAWAAQPARRSGLPRPTSATARSMRWPSRSTPADHARAIRGLILRYGTPAEGLGHGPSFRLRPLATRGPMTISVEIETRIGRPPADVFAALADVERYPEWLIASGIVRVERLDHRPARGRLAPADRTRPWPVARPSSTAAITALAPGAAFGLRGKDREGVSVEIDAVMATDEQATRLRWSVRVGLPLRFRMFESMVAPQARRAAALDLEALKRRLEAAPG